MYDIIIVGCGVTGASLAYRLSRYDLRVLILEKENDIAMGTTKANSAVIHAGYDPEPGTLMARLNVEGSRQMEEVCRQLDVLYRRVGSMVIAFDGNDKKMLRVLYDRGVKNAVPDMRLLSGDEARRLEPNLSPKVIEALFAPSAAIVDPWGLCIAQTEVAVRNGVELCRNCRVTGIEDHKDFLLIHSTGGDHKTKFLMNCAGTHGHEISAMSGKAEWEAYPARGEYHLLDRRCEDLVRHVIFQCPTKVGKGVLVAPTVHGNVIAGPTNDLTNDAEDTATTQKGLNQAARDARRSIPSIDFSHSIRNFSGVRAATSEPDFIIRPSSHTYRVIHVCGIKSPGLSAALAVADTAIGLLQKSKLILKEKKRWDNKRHQVRFKYLSLDEKKRLIAENPLYGRVICRCETITEGEIVDVIHSPVPPCSVDGVKRRAGSGMGRCQGGFCGPKVLAILARELGVDPADIPKDGAGTRILTCRTKGGAPE